MATTNGTTNGTTNTPPSTSTPIPLIDFTPILNGPPDLRTRTATALLHAFKTSGFVYLTNHSIPAPLLSSLFAASAAFFARPQPEKDALAWSTPEANRGYTRLGREKVSQGQDAGSVKEVREAEGEDIKESFEAGNPRQPGAEEGGPLANKWPDEATDDPAGAWAGAVEFRDVCERFFEAGRLLHVQIMRALAIGLGLDEGWFDGFTDEGDNTLRLLHYPPVAKRVFRERKGQVRAGAHSDYGSVTVLFQDRRGGLQVQGKGGEWVDVTPIEGTCVVNAGDLLARWSNDVVKSTLHRVVEPPAREDEDVQADEEGVYPARYSIAYFCNPNFDRWIEVIPGTVEEGKAMKYAGVNSGEYLVRRLTATY